MRFQKSIRIAPGIRINLSKSGVGVSVGPKGLKVGVDGKGQRYSSVGIPGTGISQCSYQKAGEDPFVLFSRRMCRSCGIQSEVRR